MERIILLISCFLFVGPSKLRADSSWTTFEEITLVGAGTEESPYLIHDNLELWVFRSWVNGGRNEICGKLVANINMEDPINIGTNTYYTTEWVSIGKWGCNYNGVFDGSGCTVYNLNTKGDAFQGLFGYVGRPGIVKNLKVRGNIEGYRAVGGIVGTCVGKVINCINYADVSGYEYIGGICGNSDSDIINCINYGTITARGALAGGISGYHTYAGENPIIKDCVNYGNVKGWKQTGGVVGCDISSNTTIENCRNEGTVTAERGNIAGIVGEIQYNTTVSFCTNVGKVTNTENGYYYVGGIAGVSSNGKIYNCINKAEVVSTATYVGGIVGVSYADVVGCKNTGSVKGKNYVGGIAGYYYDLSYPTSQMRDCIMSKGAVTGETKTAAIAGQGMSVLSENYYTNDVIVYDGANTYQGTTERGTWWEHNGFTLKDVYEMEDDNITYYNGAVQTARKKVADNEKIIIIGVPEVIPGETPDISDIVIRDGERVLSPDDDYEIKTDTDKGTITIEFKDDYEGEIKFPNSTGIINIHDTKRYISNIGDTIYDINGKPVSKAKSGLNIIRAKNGNYRKVFVK